MEVTRARFAQHREQILRFWERARDSDAGGFHTDIDATGTVHGSDLRSLLVQARLLYNYAEGMRAGLGFATEHAEHLYEFLTTRLRTENGWYASRRGDRWIRPEQLDSYTNLFVVIGMARYAQAAMRREVLEEAWRLFEVIENDAITDHPAEDGVRGTMVHNPIPGRHRGATRFSGNVNLHYLEALARLADADIGMDLQPRVLTLRTFFLRHILDPERMITYDRFHGGFDRPWAEPGACVSLGHSLEWLDFFRCFPGLELDERLEQGILECAAREGVRDNGLFEDAYYLTEGRCAGDAEFWPQVEAVKTFNRAASVYGEPYGEIARKLAAYYFEHFVDSDGGVFTAVALNGVVTSRTKGSHWKCDYHSMRMCVDVMEREDGAFA